MMLVRVLVAAIVRLGSVRLGLALETIVLRLDVEQLRLDGAHLPIPRRRASSAIHAKLGKPLRELFNVRQSSDSWLDLVVSVLQLCSTMKTATVRDLRNRYTDLLAWVEAGQEIRITRSGRAVARLVPERSNTPRVAWSESPAVQRTRRRVAKATGKTLDRVRQDSSGRW